MVSNHSQGLGSRKFYQVDAEVCENTEANTSNRDSQPLAETEAGEGRDFPKDTS